MDDLEGHPRSSGMALFGGPHVIPLCHLIHLCSKICMIIVGPT